MLCCMALKSRHCAGPYNAVVCSGVWHFMMWLSAAWSSVVLLCEGNKEKRQTHNSVVV